MKLEKLNQSLTLLANFAVLVGIIFLVLEIRQSTQATEAAAIQASTEVARSNISMLIENPELIRLINADPKTLDSNQRELLFWVSRNFWLSMQGLFRQRQLEVLPDGEWESWIQIICINASEGGLAGKGSWQRNKNVLTKDFVEMVETKCESVAP